MYCWRCRGLQPAHHQVGGVTPLCFVHDSWRIVNRSLDLQSLEPLSSDTGSLPPLQWPCSTAALYDTTLEALKWSECLVATIIKVVCAKESYNIPQDQARNTALSSIYGLQPLWRWHSTQSCSAIPDVDVVKRNAISIYEVYAHKNTSLQ